MGSKLGTIGEISEIFRVGSEELSVEWKIQNFPTLPGDTINYYTSPEFKFGDENWLLELWPNWGIGTENPASGWMDIGLRRCDEGPPTTLNIRVGVRGSRGVEMKREIEKEFGLYVRNEFCSRSELIDHCSRLMPNNILVITFVMKSIVSSAARGVSSNQVASIQSDAGFREQNVLISGSQSVVDKQDASTQTYCEFKEARVGEQHSSEKQGIERVAEDVGKLLASGKKSDITVQVGEAEFKAHSLILSARSPVLSAMLEHETVERSSNRIVISDCEPDVFAQFLHYLYTGSVQLLSQQAAFGLYRVADKYLADDLKLLCLKLIRDTLSVRTFCDAVKLALTHGESDLLDQAMDFATQNIRLIIRSVEWQHFGRDFPTEANEILIKALGPPS